MGKIYQSFDSLKPVKLVLDESGKALKDATRTLRSKGVPEILGAAAGAGIGIVAGTTIVAAGAAKGAVGAAALTSGLATAGGLVGGGMLTGVFVASAPVAILAVTGYGVLAKRNKEKLKKEKQSLLFEAIRKHDAILREQEKRVNRSQDRVTYLETLIIKLQDIIKNLEADLT